MKINMRIGIERDGSVKYFEDSDDSLFPLTAQEAADLIYSNQVETILMESANAQCPPAKPTTDSSQWR